MRIPTSGPDPTNERIRREAREHVQAEVYASYERTETELRDWTRVLTATLISERRRHALEMRAKEKLIERLAKW